MAIHHTILLCAASAAAGVAVALTLTKLRKENSPNTPVTEHHTNSTPTDLALLLEAAHFSAQKHRDQRRKNPTQAPYICHPISVARRLAVDAGVTDINVLIAALLHDTVEDTDTTLLEVENAFGSKVATIVDQVSDDKTLPKEERKRLQIVNAPHASIDAKLVKLADKLDNLSDLLVIAPTGWKPERVAQYFDWSHKVIAGLRGTSPVLESMLDTVLEQKAFAMKKSNVT